MVSNLQPFCSEGTKPTALLPCSPAVEHEESFDKSNQAVYSHEFSLWNQQSPSGGHYCFARSKALLIWILHWLGSHILYLFSLASAFDILKKMVGGLKHCFIYANNKADRQTNKEKAHTAVDKNYTSTLNGEVTSWSWFPATFRGALNILHTFVHSAALEQMAVKQMLWEGRSSPTTSGMSLCAGSTFFSGYSYWIFKKGVKNWFLPLWLPGITAAADTDGSTRTGVVNPA